MKTRKTPLKLLLIGMLVVTMAATITIWTVLEVKGKPDPKPRRISFDMLRIGPDQTAELVFGYIIQSALVSVQFVVYAPDHREDGATIYGVVGSLSADIALAPGEWASIPFPPSNEHQRVTASLLIMNNPVSAHVQISRRDTLTTDIILTKSVRPCD